MLEKRFVQAGGTPPHPHHAGGHRGRRRFSSRYLTDRFLPDKALDLLDEGAAHVWLGGGPAEDAERQQQLEQQLEQAVANAQYEQAAKLRDELRTLVRRQLAARRAQRTVSLTRQDIAAVVSERTGIPVGRLRQSDRERLLSLRRTLSERIIGQQAAVDAVSTAVLRGRTGLADAGRPAASFLLIGPTGVGKQNYVNSLRRSSTAARTRSSVWICRNTWSQAASRACLARLRAMSATTQAERSRKRCAAVHTALYCSMSWKRRTGILPVSFCSCSATGS